MTKRSKEKKQRVSLQIEKENVFQRIGRIELSKTSLEDKMCHLEAVLSNLHQNIQSISLYILKQRNFQNNYG